MASKPAGTKSPPTRSKTTTPGRSRNVSRGTSSSSSSASVTTQSAAPPPPPTRQQRYDAATAKVQQVAPTQSIGRQNYQPIILVEYIGCLLLTVTTPIATKKAANGLSPYAGADMVKIASLTILYFILAAISVGGRGPGRFAAWFGGLILIVDGMYEASNLAKDFGLFTGGLASAASTTPAAAAPAAAPEGLNSPSLVQNVVNAALNPPGLGQ